MNEGGNIAMDRKRSEFDRFTSDEYNSEVSDMNYWWYTQGDFDMEMANEFDHATVGWWSNNWSGWDEIKIREKHDGWFDKE
ncbi:MAG: hypothetical protein AWU54_240 [Candidatus Frackibacter sp. T328-2]|nr:MAG: hypothetical protein AWU54_240 [Candidatus Frackibacter sp. T328-2]